MGNPRLDRWPLVALVMVLGHGTVAGQKSVDELASRLDRVHREGNAGREVEGFSATLQLDTNAEGSISVGLQVDFETVKRDRGTRHHIKCTVEEGTKVLVRGLSREGYWTKIDDEVIYLTRAEHEQERNNIARDIRLARQLLKYLDPGDVVRRLGNVIDVSTEDLQLGRSDPIPCRVVEGVVDSFPLYQVGGEVGGAHLKIWVEASSGRLIAVRATALSDDGDPDPSRRELIRLSKHRKEPDGKLLLPTELKFFTFDAASVPRLQVTVGLHEIDLFR